MTVTIDRGSWHYKVYRFMNDPFVLFDRWTEPTAQQLTNRQREPKALCGYFWTIALSPLLLVGAYATAAVFGAVIGTLFAIGWSAIRLYRLVRRSRVAEPVGLAASYAAARKARVCPRVVVR